MIVNYKNKILALEKGHHRNLKLMDQVMKVDKYVTEKLVHYKFGLDRLQF